MSPNSVTICTQFVVVNEQFSAFSKYLRIVSDVCEHNTILFVYQYVTMFVDACVVMSACLRCIYSLVSSVDVNVVCPLSIRKTYLTRCGDKAYSTYPPTTCPKKSTHVVNPLKPLNILQK